MIVFQTMSKSLILSIKNIELFVQKVLPEKIKANSFNIYKNASL